MLLNLPLSYKNSRVRCAANGQPMVYRYWREADTHCIAIDFFQCFPARETIYRDFVNYREAVRWAKKDFERRQTLRLVA